LKRETVKCIVISTHMHSHSTVQYSC